MIDNQGPTIGRKLNCPESKQKEAGKRNSDQSDDPELALFFDDKIRDQQDHSKRDQLELGSDRTEILHLKELVH